jgi:apolipoprotein N-acyltransferase
VEHDAVDRASYFNRAYLLAPNGEIAGTYDKRILVPFGEFVPLQSLLFFVEKLVEGVGGFSSGPHQPPLAFGGHAASVQICYEAIFPQLAREQTAAGADLLVNITNDAWFGDTAAPLQHLAMAAFRAVENRRPLLRAANTGISALVGIDGSITQPTELFTAGYRVYSVRWPLVSTYYTRHGDVFAVGCAVVGSALLLACLVWRR